jgi:beta-glucanase (GH16 family)
VIPATQLHPAEATVPPVVEPTPVDPTTPTDPTTTPTDPTTTPTDSSTTPTDPTPTPADSTPPLAGNWNMTWHDEFEGTTLNPVWHAAQYWDRDHTIVGQGELEVYDPSAVSVSGGMLHLTAREEEMYGMPYASGLVQTGGYDGDPSLPKFSFQYGYMEVRAKIPSGQGIWPAIWMMPASYNDGNGELDVLEVIGSEPNVANFSLHRNGSHQTRTWTGADFSQDFHTFGVDWRPDHVTWYVDGVARLTMTDPTLICPEAMYPILNVAVGGDWPGAPDATTRFPATMDVDYVRVWQQALVA